jgi:endo-1,4-beta-D-glucanase Y
MPMSDLFEGLLKPAQKYMLKQCEDAALFMAYATTALFEAGDLWKLTKPQFAAKLAKSAAKWVLEHGTPTPEKVKETLGL